jgi:hypothetical protein
MGQGTTLQTSKSIVRFVVQFDVSFWFRQVCDQDQMASLPVGVETLVRFGVDDDWQTKIVSAPIKASDENFGGSSSTKAKRLEKFVVANRALINADQQVHVEYRFRCCKLLRLIFLRCR